MIAWSGLPAEQITANLRIKRLAASIISTIFIPLLLLLMASSILALIALNFTLSLRFQGLDEGSLVGQLVMTGHIYQLVFVLLTVTLFNPQFTPGRGDPFVVSELSDFLHWAIPLGFVGVLVLETLLIAHSW